MSGAPTVTVAIAAYNSERWIGETIDSILAQTRPPDQIVVVDDGSTDATPRELERFGDRLEVVCQANAGAPRAYNRAFAEARGDYVALASSDDLWEPRKLEWQVEALAGDLTLDVTFSHARTFGIEHGDWPRPAGVGVLDPDDLIRQIYPANMICAPSALIRRSLHERLGGFREDLAGEDYDFWLRSLGAGAVFHYDPRCLLHYRRHGQNLSLSMLPMMRMTYEVHRIHSGLVIDRRLVRRVLAKDLFDIARTSVDEDEPRAARAAFLASLHQRPNARAAAWVVVLSLPWRARTRLGAALVAARRWLRAPDRMLAHRPSKAGRSRGS